MKKKRYVVKGTIKGKRIIISPTQSRFTRKGASAFLKRVRKNSLTKKIGIKNPKVVESR